MALIVEEKQLEEVQGFFRLRVLQYGYYSIMPSKRIIGLELDNLAVYTPNELRIMAKWLNSEAERIDNEYDCNANPIKQEEI